MGVLARERRAGRIATRDEPTRDASKCGDLGRRRTLDTTGVDGSLTAAVCWTRRDLPSINDPLGRMTRLQRGGPRRSLGPLGPSWSPAPPLNTPRGSGRQGRTVNETGAGGVDGEASPVPRLDAGDHGTTRDTDPRTCKNPHPDSPIPFTFPGVSLIFRIPFSTTSIPHFVTPTIFSSVGVDFSRDVFRHPANHTAFVFFGVMFCG